MDDDKGRRAALTRFLRARRERLSPAQVGLPPGGRRRTPGLRREELAQIAGVGTTWYTWLEQGRDIKVSAGVLDSIARALQLDPDERALRNIIEAVEPYPAYAMDARWTVVAWNAAACRVFADFAALSPRERNIVWFAFTHPSQRLLLVEWEREVRGVLALFRSSTGPYVNEPWFRDLVADLEAVSPEFRAWWPRGDVRAAHGGPKTLDHPHVGRLVVQPTTLQVADAPGLRLAVYPPADADTSRKLTMLYQSARVARPVAHPQSEDDAAPAGRPQAACAPDVPSRADGGGTIS